MAHIIKRRNVQLEGEPPSPADGERVTLLRDGDVVHAIQVRCSCGATTLVELEYEPAPGTASEAR